MQISRDRYIFVFQPLQIIIECSVCIEWYDAAPPAKLVSGATRTNGVVVIKPFHNLLHHKVNSAILPIISPDERFYFVPVECVALNV